MNLKAEEPDAIDQHVWVPAGADPKAGWLAGGTYLVARRINMTIETWDRQPLREQERVIGRTKAEGAPLSGGSEFSQPDFALKGRGDEPLVATDAHVRLVHPDTQRRRPDAAPRLQLRRRQQRVSVGSMPGCSSSPTSATRAPTSSRSRPRSAIGDALSEYLQHTGSGLFAVPPGIAPGEYVGQALFA